MHLVLLIVVPHARKLFAGLNQVNKKKDEDSIMPRATVAIIGRALLGARRTVPMAQARSLRNIDVHIKSFMAADWLHFILCSGEFLLEGWIPDAYFKIFIALSRAGRSLLRPRGVTKAEIEEIDKDIKYFVAKYYAKIYRGTAERLPLWLSRIVSLLDIVPCLWACGSAWVFWQFPMELKIGALGKLILSASKRHESLVANETPIPRRMCLKATGCLFPCTPCMAGRADSNSAEG